ncbi:MAG: RND transporter [Thermodesulfobacteriota bacterium]
MRRFLQDLTWPMLAILCLTLGLAPFAPPHIWEKLSILVAHGRLAAPVDWFDLAMHGAPWLLVVAKLIWGRGE